VFWTRLESWATPGIPDCHGIVDGFPFWLELKLHSLKSLKYVNLSPHQIAWQIRYSGKSGCVLNLVGHPSSNSINIFRGERAMDIGPTRDRKEELTPDWESVKPYDWEGMLDFILSQKKKK
jgi:hypothetical protein